MVNLQTGVMPLLQGQTVPRVKGTKEAENYPSSPGSESVYFDAEQEDIIYIKVTEKNGFSRTVRYHCYEEPEPTTEDILKNDFITKDEFASFVNEFRDFRKEMMQNAQFASGDKSTAGNGKQHQANNAAAG